MDMGWKTPWLPVTIHINPTYMNTILMPYNKKKKKNSNFEEISFLHKTSSNFSWKLNNLIGFKTYNNSSKVQFLPFFFFIFLTSSSSFSDSQNFPWSLYVLARFAILLRVRGCSAPSSFFLISIT